MDADSQIKWVPEDSGMASETSWNFIVLQEAYFILFHVTVFHCMSSSHLKSHEHTCQTCYKKNIKKSFLPPGLVEIHRWPWASSWFGGCVRICGYTGRLPAQRWSSSCDFDLQPTAILSQNQSESDRINQTKSDIARSCTLQWSSICFYSAWLLHIHECCRVGLQFDFLE